MNCLESWFAKIIFCHFTWPRIDKRIIKEIKKHKINTLQFFSDKKWNVWQNGKYKQNSDKTFTIYIGKNQLFEICKSKFSLVLFDHIIAIIEIYNPSEIKKSKAKSNETSKDKWFVKKMNGQIIAERKMIKSKII